MLNIDKPPRGRAPLKSRRYNWSDGDVGSDRLGEMHPRLIDHVRPIADRKFRGILATQRRRITYQDRKMLPAITEQEKHEV